MKHRMCKGNYLMHSKDGLVYKWNFKNNTVSTIRQSHAQLVGKPLSQILDLHSKLFPFLSF